MDTINLIKALDIQDFAVLCAVYETRSYTHAARQVNTTITTCRRVMEKFEKLTGYKLVQVNANNLYVMPESEPLYQVAKTLLQQSDLLLQQAHTRQKITLYLGAYFAMILTQSSTLFSSQRLWNIDIATYSQMMLQDYGLLAKHLIDYYDITVIEAEFEHLIDAALWIAKYRKRYSLKAYATSTYLTTHGTPKTIDELPLHCCIGSKTELLNGWGIKDKDGATLNLTTHTTMYFDTILAKYSAASNHLGIVCLTDEIVTRMGKTQLIPVLPEYDFGDMEVALYVKADLQHPQLNALLDILKTLI